MKKGTTCRCGSSLRYEHCCKGLDLNPQYAKSQATKHQTKLARGVRSRKISETDEVGLMRVIRSLFEKLHIMDVKKRKK